MQTIQGRFLPAAPCVPAIYLRDACLTLKMSAFPRAVQDALLVIGGRYGFQVGAGTMFRMSTGCLQARAVVRVLSA